MNTLKKYLKPKIKALKVFAKTDVGTALIITIIWKILLLVIGYILELCIYGESSSITKHTMGWDSTWYLAIITDQYGTNNSHFDTNPATPVFYPLFPMAVSIVKFVGLGLINVEVSGQIVNTISVFFIVLGLLKLSKQFFDKKKKYWLVALVLTAPTAFFLHLFYSEAIFMAIGIWSYIFALRQNWLKVGILLAFLSASRLPAILFIGLCGLEFMRSYDWKIKKIFNKNLLYFLLAPIGFIAFGFYLLYVRGDFLSMFHSYNAVSYWNYQNFNINFIETILKAAYQVPRAMMGQRAFDINLILYYVLPVLSIITLGLSSLYLIIKQKNHHLALGIIGILSLIMFTINGNVVSVNRYALPCLAIYFAITLLINGKRQKNYFIILCAAGFAFQLILLALFISNVFVA